jgi:hypothetical protein
LQGATLPWFVARTNHNHGRYNDLVTTVKYRSGRQVMSRVPAEIATFGYSLPCSDPELSAMAGPACQ